MRDRALSLQRGFEDRLAGGTERFEGGTAIFRPELPRVFDFNFLRVEERVDGAGALADAAERLQASAGLLHRKIVIEDEATGEALLDEFRSLGWLADRQLLMVLDTPLPDAVEPPAELVSPRELLPAQELNIRGDPHERSPEVVGQLLAAEITRAESLPTHAVAVRLGAAVASWCLLYTLDGVTEVDQVTTLPEHQRRGYGHAVMRAAIGQAGAAESDFVFLWADDRDWPKDWYARLGFEPLARRYAFLRRPR